MYFSQNFNLVIEYIYIIIKVNSLYISYVHVSKK